MPPRWDLDRQYSGPRRVPLRPKEASRQSGAEWAPGIRRPWRIAFWAVAGAALGLVLAFGAATSRRAAAPLELVSWGTVEERVAVKALVIRREQVEVAPISGRLTRLAAEGGGVAAGDPVVELVNPEARAFLASRAAGVKEAWAQFQKEKEGELQAAVQRVAELQAAVDGSLATLRRAATAADEKGLQQAWEGLDQVSAKLAAAQGTLSRLERERADLLSQKARLGSLEREAAVRLTASAGGLVFYRVDGLEPLLRPDRLAEADLSLVDHPPPLLSPASDRVLAGQPLFKVVDAEYAVLAFRLAEADAAALLRRREVRFRVGAATEAAAGAAGGLRQDELAGRILFLGPPDPGGSRAVFVRLQSLLDGRLALDRVVQGAVLLKTAQGPRVPVAALAADPGSPVPGETTRGVYLAEGGKARWVPVEVEASDGTWAVVQGVRVGSVLAPPDGERNIR